MKRIILTTISIMSCFLLKSQNLIINDSILKVGIYRDFNEFKYNNPSIKFDYQISTIEHGYGFLNSSGTVTFYRISIDKKAGKAIGNIFGFCDGKNVYINENLPRLGPKAGFSKIEYFGLYCYFESIFYQTAYNGTNSYTTSSLAENVINMSNGEVIRLTKKTLKELIANDEELLTEFNNESQKNKKLKDYIIKYLEKRK
jgi:hypothetical protein